MSLIKIDGITYDVGEIELKRDAEIIYDSLTQGVMLDFSEVDDAVATKYTYSFTVEPRCGLSDKETLLSRTQAYDAFYYDITSPKSVRFVELPFGQRTIAFNAKIKAVSDILYKNYNSLSRWSSLNVTFLPGKPQRYTN
ncbi:MAG: hypothetical protein FWD71_03335 [Oscillospiraceae bacterium]|nr:hypothetical protein [Oscillospiraceae bacterium]